MPIKSILKQAYRSLKIDIEFITCKYPEKLLERFEFIFKKYLILFKHLIIKIPTQPTKSFAKIGSTVIYYDSYLGISNIQSMTVFVHKKLFRYIQHLKSPTIIDVGAHNGYFSINMANLFHNSRIFACEPLSLTYRLLKKNTHNIRNITPVRIGFSEKKAKKKMYYEKTLLVYSSLYSERFTWHKNPSIETVDLMSLDEFIIKHGIDFIDILKIDTEGAEELVLKGAKKTLKNTHFLILECAMDNIRSSTFSSLIHHLYRSDYNFQLLDIGNILHFPSAGISTMDILFENLKFR